MKTLIYAVAILLLVNSCTTTDIPPRPGPHHQRLNAAELKAHEQPIFTSATNAYQSGGVEDVELKIGESAFINEDAARRQLSAVSDDGESVLNF